MIGYIYKITNKLTGKCYIGKHKYNLPKLDEKYITSGIYINKAINKDGLESFDRELIATADTAEQLNELERYYINYYNSLFPNGYNLTLGGDGISEPTPEILKINREKHLNKKQSEYTKQKRIISLKKVIHSKEWSEKISKSLKNKKPSDNTKEASIKAHTGSQWYNDGKKEFLLKRTDNHDGLVKGQLKNHFGDQTGTKHSLEHNKKISVKKKNKLWYNNGTIEIMCLESDVPQDFHRGRLPLSEERKEKCRQNGRKSHKNK